MKHGDVVGRVEGVSDRKQPDRYEEDVLRSVERMLRATPPRYLVGLSRVVLRDAGGLRRKERLTRKRLEHKGRVRMGEYHHAVRGSQARIELFVDEILYQDSQPWLLRLRLMRDLFLAATLFHEIGHHIQAAIEPEYADKERTADSWRNQLTKRFFRSEHACFM